MTRRFLQDVAAKQRAELYCELHPGSPSAVRAPKIFSRSGVWVALLGKSVRDGIAGFGPTVESALRAFDQTYLNYLHQAGEVPALDQAP
ncbi:MAG: hypothetical protein ACJ8M4_04885 [Chthoniobacterales bacterium]